MKPLGINNGTTAQVTAYVGQSGWMTPLWDTEAKRLYVRDGTAQQTYRVVMSTELSAFVTTESLTQTLSSYATVAALNGKADASHTHTTAQVTGLDTALAGKVGTTGDQSIAGAKTFTGSVTVPTPTADGHAATKAYVDGMQDDTAASILAAFQQFNEENGIS